MAAFEKGEISMFITVLVTVCLNLAVQGTCVTMPVVNSSQDQVSMVGCMGLQGMESAKEFWQHHPLYHGWQSRGWACRSGTAPHPRREIRKVLLRHCEARTAGGLAVTDRLIVAVLEKKEDDAHQVNVEQSR